MNSWSELLLWRLSVGNDNVMDMCDQKKINLHNSSGTHQK